MALLLVAPQMKAVEFAYEAGAEVVSAYLWRGLYNGGLSLQPDLEIGYDGEHSSLRVGVWGSVGASDWKFVKNLPTLLDGSNPNTGFKAGYICGAAVVLAALALIGSKKRNR